MKKYLPIHNSSKGFTLIELMVVIAILAILAMIGVGAYNGVQGNARDARRLAEIDSLVKNIESTKDPSDGKYTYTSNMFSTDYPKGLKDPDGISDYCIYMRDTTAITAPTSNPSSNPGGTLNNVLACPAVAQSASRGGGASGSYVAITTSMATQGPNDYFSVCSVRAERGSKPICKSQLTK